MNEKLIKRAELFLNNVINVNHNDLMEIIHEDIVIEFPYHFPNTPNELVGREAVRDFFKNFSNFLVLEKIQLQKAYQIEGEGTIIIESIAKGKNAQNGTPYFQKYFTVLTYKDDKIIGWKDYWNPVEVLITASEDSFKKTLFDSPLFKKG